jgi:hypothetical protein
MSTRPLCFVLMPFGKKAETGGALIDFDRVYHDLIEPAIRDAELEPLRADEEMSGGIIHKPMFERLILCPFAVADLTLANANVYYELGIRHAARPWSTVLLFADGGRLPFDVHMLRVIPYKLSALQASKPLIIKYLDEARNGIKDSPIFQMLDYVPEPVIDHTRTDVFREQVEYSAVMKQRLADARRNGIEDVRSAETALGDVENVEAAILVDLLLSYRAVEGYGEMAALVEKMPRPVAETVLVQEQLAFALNRMKKREQAEAVLMSVIDKRGPSSETYGLLGRVYKDQWEDAKTAGEKLRARGLIDKAIDAYLKGFEFDWRDAYPGVNAVTLMELREPPDPRSAKILPVVRYSVERKIAKGKSDYWDYATLLELAILAMDENEAAAQVARALAVFREPWERKTTARNLRLLREARTARGLEKPWMIEIENALVAL